MGTRKGTALGAALFALTAGSVAVVATGATQAQVAPITIQVLGTNDFHGRISLAAPNGGGAVLSGAVHQLRDEYPNTVFAGAGDLVGATTFESFIQNDKPTIDVLNAASLDVSAVGNHEFDQGFSDLTDRIMNPAAPDGGAEWAYIGANVRYRGTGARALTESWTADFEGVTVGFVGAVTEHLPELVSPAGIADIEVTDIVAETNAVADELTAEGADIVVLLVHEGAATTSIDSATDPGSDFGKIVLGVDDDVDAIVSGHTHLEYNHLIDGRPVVSAGQYGLGLNQLLFSVDPATGGILGVESNFLPLLTGSTPNFPADPVVTDIVTAANEYAAEIGAQQLGTIEGPFYRAKNGAGGENRGAESTLGNFVAEAQRFQTDTQIAFMNPGGLRADLIGNAGTPAEYPAVLTYAQAAGVQPFGNTLVTMNLTGDLIRQALEQQWQPAGAARPRLQLGVSEGFTYTYDPAAPAGERITAMWLHGEPIDLAATYKVTVNSFLASGGDNFPAFTLGTNHVPGSVDLQTMVEYFQVNPVAAPDFTQRSVGISFPPGAPAAYEPGQTVTFDVSSFTMPGTSTPDLTVRDGTLLVALDGVGVGVFPVDNAVAAAATDDEAGRATVTFAVPAGTAPGEHVLTVTGGSTGTTTTVPLTTSASRSTTTLVASAPSQTYKVGSPVTLTASVVTGGGQFPAGKVEFVTAKGVVATVALAADGTARYRLPITTPAGEVTVTARYLGSATTGGSQSAPVTVVVERAASTTVLVATSTTQRYGALLPAILISATGLETGELARGHVEFREGTKLVGRSGMLLGLSAVVLPRTLSVGTHTFTATFVPADQANYEGSTSNPVTITVRR